MSSAIDWDAFRRQMPHDPTKINLNAGTLSPVPLPVSQRVQELRTQQATNPTDFLARRLPIHIEQGRAALAKYLNVPTHELLLLENPTVGANVIFDSLQLPPGSQVITTDHEYGGLMLALHRRARRDGLEVITLKLPYRSENPEEIIELFEGAINHKTSTIFCSHITASMGLCLPIEKLTKLAHEKGIMIAVDGAHAAGAIELDLTKLGADVYVGSCHKWMMAPLGAAFLHVRDEHKMEVEPLIGSWGLEYTAENRDQDSGWGGTYWQRAFEFHGTTDRCAQMVLPEVLAFRESLGGEAVIRKRMRELSDYARKTIGGTGLEVATPIYPSGPNLTAFEFPCEDMMAARNWLWNTHGIECAVTPGGGKTFLRVSTGWFNTTDEIDRLAKALSQYPKPN